MDPSIQSSPPRHDGRARRTPVPGRTAARREAHPARRGPAAPDRDRGTTLLFTFVAALLTMVGLICLVAIIDATWFLIVAVALDLVITAGVLTMLFRLAGDEDGA